MVPRSHSETDQQTAKINAPETPFVLLHANAAIAAAGNSARPAASPATAGTAIQPNRSASTKKLSAIQDNPNRKKPTPNAHPASPARMRLSPTVRRYSAPNATGKSTGIENGGRARTAKAPRPNAQNVRMIPDILEMRRTVMPIEITEIYLEVSDAATFSRPEKISKIPTPQTTKTSARLNAGQCAVPR